MKHKNLPWIARQDADGGLWTVLDSAGNVVFFGMQEHVAKTFAAAPDLAEALLAAPDFGGEPTTAFGHEYREWQKIARAALAKAGAE